MKKWAALLLLMLALTLSAQAEEAVEYYYENYCGSCHPEEDFREEYRALTGESLDSRDYLHYNVATDAGRAAYEEMLARTGVDGGNLPVVIVDGQAFTGSAAISARLPEYAVSRMENTDSVMYFLHVSACESCAEAEALLRALPETITVSMGRHSFESAVRVIDVNINDQTGLAHALFDAYAVPDDKRLSPILLAGDAYYQGADAIRLMLNLRLKSGAALNTRIVTAPAELPALELGGAFAAGLVGGLNPCALSMLLLLLSILLELRSGALKLSFVFLTTKLVMYFLIGCVFLEAFSRWNPGWLSMAVKLVLTAVSLVLIALNLRDAMAARRERYGDVRNQLPATLRGRIHRRIRSLRSAQGALLPAVILLGVFVSAAEFLCSGQVYLAAILARVQDGAHTLESLPVLLLYCLGFLLPSLAVCVLTARGKTVMAMSDALLTRMPLVKLLTALIHVLILAYVWLM